MKKLRNLDSYRCSKCKDTYWIAEGNNFKRCRCFELREAGLLFKNSGITDENYTFSNFEEWNEQARIMKNTAVKYYQVFSKIKDGKQNSIAFLGQSGSGKSHLTIALGLNILRTKKIAVIYLSYRDAITRIKQNVLNEEFYKKQLGKYCDAKLLIIDDMLKGKITEADKNFMFELVNYRYIKRLPMIISSEYTIQDIINFDEAIGGRIYEMCKNFLVEIDKNIKNNYRLK